MSNVPIWWGFAVPLSLVSLWAVTWAERRKLERRVDALEDWANGAFRDGPRLPSRRRPR